MDARKQIFTTKQRQTRLSQYMMMDKHSKSDDNAQVGKRDLEDMLELFGYNEKTICSER